MAIKDRFALVNFGSSYAGSSTVGYTLYRVSDGSEHTARSTTNVTELGTNTGVFAAKFNLDDSESVYLLWDTGGGSPRYAASTEFAELSIIRDEVSKIPMIFNTIKNNADFQGEVTRRLAKMNDLALMPDQIQQAVSDTMKQFELEKPRVDDDAFGALAKSDDVSRMVTILDGNFINRANSITKQIEAGAQLTRKEFKTINQSLESSMKSIAESLKTLAGQSDLALAIDALNQLKQENKIWGQSIVKIYTDAIDIFKAAPKPEDFDMIKIDAQLEKKLAIQNQIVGLIHNELKNVSNSKQEVISTIKSENEKINKELSMIKSGYNNITDYLNRLVKSLDFKSKLDYLRGLK